MKFEALLARRYITAQKRHSIFTVGSIIIAVAFMTMIFTCFTTWQGIMRDIHYDEKPYHMMFYSVNKVQAKAISDLIQVGSTEMKENKDGSVEVRVMFDQYIGDDPIYTRDLLVNLKIAPELKNDSYYDSKLHQYVDTNYELLEDDLLTLTGRYLLVQKIALLFVYVVAMAIALRLMIDTAFEISSKEREKQFGVLQSVGATPKQIVHIITHEGMMLSAVGLPFGALLGIGFGYIVYRGMLSTGVAEVFLDKEKIPQLVNFHINLWMTLASMLAGLVWVWLSAYSTGMRIIKKSPIESITARSENIKKVKKHSLSGLLLGWTGKMAVRNSRRQPKRFAVTVVSLTISLLLFSFANTLISQLSDDVIAAFRSVDYFGYTTADFEVSFSDYGHYGRGLSKQDSFVEPLRTAEESGYFSEIDYYLDYTGKMMQDGKEKEILVFYVTRDNYKRIFGKNEQISYDELTGQNAAVAINFANDFIPEGTKEVSMKVGGMQIFSEEEYNKLKEQGEEGLKDYGDTYWRGISTDATFRLAANYADLPFLLPEELNKQYNLYPGVSAMLVMTVDEYLNGMKDYHGNAIYGGWLFTVTLEDDAYYEAARQFLYTHSEYYNFDINDKDEMEWADKYKMQQMIKTVIAAVQIGTNAVNIMLTLIAMVNLMNVVSTGILNRKPELAAMQCVGMTEGQMYRMIATECMQFVIGSAVTATILSVVLVYATQRMLVATELIEDIGNQAVTYMEPLPRIWIAAGVAYLLTLLVSMAPLLRMRKESLVDQLRSVE